MAKDTNANNSSNSSSGATAAMLAAKIGKQADYHEGSGLIFHVEIVDAREVFGRWDYLIRPMSGHGQRWVSSVKLTVKQ